ncbi:MAG: hypothetical protein WC393_00110 [Candidatus Nanoarchaeia archaeon]|jgi:ssDNA-binding Zn-finger/Zn-ribbon topoisomerase 1
MASEYKRTCKRCGKVWHSLVKREKELESNKTMSELGGIASGMTCSPFGLLAQNQYMSNRNNTKHMLEDLRKCPECGSSKYSQELKLW